MKKRMRIVAIFLAVFCLMELSGCKSIAKALHIPYGQAKKLSLSVE